MISPLMKLLEGFGYDFGSLSEESGHQDELWEAFGSMFKVGPRLNPIVELRGMFPVLRILVGHFCVYPGLPF